MRIARTEDQVYQAFLLEHQADGQRWRDWWRRQWMRQLDYYLDMKFWLIPCGRWSKRPLAGFRWSERSMTREEAIYYAGAGMNLAVKAGSLVVLDYDHQDGKESDTLTMVTSKGKQFWSRGPFDGRYGSKLRAAGFDTPRSGEMFALVPLSKTCAKDVGGKCQCAEHDFRVREWLDIDAEILPFRKVARELLSA